MINYIKNLFGKEKQPEKMTKEQLEQIEKLVDAKISKVIDAIKKDNPKIDVNYKWYRNDESAVDDIGQIGAAIRNRDFNLYKGLQEEYGYTFFPPFAYIYIGGKCVGKLKLDCERNFLKITSWTCLCL